MLDAHAEAECAHARQIVDAPVQLFHHLTGRGIGPGEQIRQGFGVIASTSSPWNLPQIEAVVDAEVREGRQSLLVDGVPESQFSGDSIVEPLQQRQAIAALRGCRQPQQLHRRDVFEERGVGRGRRVVEFVDDDDVEVMRVEVAQTARTEALNRGEDVFEVGRTPAVHPQLTEAVFAQRVTERPEALLEDFLAVGHEEQPRPG